MVECGYLVVWMEKQTKNWRIRKTPQTMLTGKRFAVRTQTHKFSTKLFVSGTSTVFAVEESFKMDIYGLLKAYLLIKKMYL